MAMYPCLSLPPLSFPTLTGSIVTFNSQYAGLPLKSHTVNIDSVSGADSIHIQNTAGINQWDEEWEQGSINDSTGEPSTSNYYSRSKNFIKLIPNTSYYFYSKTSAQVVMYEYDYNHNYIGLKVATNSVQNTRNNTCYIKIRISGGNYTQGNVSINYPATDTDYHAFVGQSITVQIGSTVNEGEYDAKTGILEVTLPSVQTIQLPPCPIDTLLGENNIWADTGDTSLQYPKFG